jgi:restriction system protein
MNWSQIVTGLMRSNRQVSSHTLYANTEYGTNNLTKNYTVNIHQLLNTVDNMETIPDTREYWLIRTQSGQLYDNFIEHNFVAIDHDRLTLKMLYDLKRQFNDEKQLKNEIKSRLDVLYKGEDLNPALAAGQIIKFVYHIKKNDIVIIPSEGSNRISFGIVNDSVILEISSQDLKRTGCDYKKRKDIKWIKTVKKNN